MTRPDLAGHIGRMRELYAPRQRTDVDLVREVHAAARALATATESWQTFLPRAAAVESARSNVAGLQRLLTELAATQQGVTDA